MIFVWLLLLLLGKHASELITSTTRAKLCIDPDTPKALAPAIEQPTTFMQRVLTTPTLMFLTGQPAFPEPRNAPSFPLLTALFTSGLIDVCLVLLCCYDDDL